MEFLKEWTLCVCLALIISVIFSMLAPSGSMKSFTKIMLSVFIFISFIYPLKDFSAADFKIDADNSVFTLDESVNTAYENGINMQIKGLLLSKNITGINVSSRVLAKAEKGEIEIKEVVIYIPDEYKKDEVAKLVFDELGINTRVVYLGE